MPSDRIYLDYAASTPVDPRVLEAMHPFFKEKFANPSSLHFNGQESEHALETSRQEIAQILGCSASELLFTSCGTESDNLALRGVGFHAREHRDAAHILTTPVEHPAVLRTARDMALHHGFELELLPVNEYGQVDPADLKSRIRADTALVSVIYANNEIGTINSISELAQICRNYGVPFHSDGVQAASQLNLAVEELHVDLLSIGAHKFYGPKGVGALFVRSDTKLWPVQTGGSQEFGLRAGTHNVPYIVGMAEALKIAVSEREEHNAHQQMLRDRLLSSIPELIPDCLPSGHPVNRLPNHASFVFQGVDGNQLITALDIAGFACSSGSACKTGAPEPSEVLSSLGFSREWALGSLRITVGRQTTRKDISHLLEVLPGIVSRLRSSGE